MPPLLRKPLIRIVAFAALAISSVSLMAPAPGLAQGASATAATPPPPAVTVAQPLRRHITEWDEHIARLEPSSRVELRARVSGQVAEVHFRDGQMVKQGDLLFTLDRRPFEIAVDAARAEVARAQARLDLAEQEIERTASLVRDRVAPQAQLDSRRAAQREAVGTLAAARAQLRQAELELEWSEVRAPNAGRVSDRRVDAGNLIQQGETLLTTILTLDPIYASFDMSEADYLRLSRQVRRGSRASDREGGAQVRLRMADEETWSWQGKLDFLDTALDPRSGTVRARALLPNEDLFLTPGVFARLRLFAGEGEQLLVPDAAVAADQASRVVLTVNAEGRVVPKPISLGPLVEGLRVVRSGLSPEDRVIIQGLHRARPGALVTAETKPIEQGPTQVVEAR
jgi:RND family efflux transporter MFP subunit